MTNFCPIFLHIWQLSKVLLHLRFTPLWKFNRYWKNLGRNMYRFLINDIIYVYYVSPGNKLLLMPMNNDALYVGIYLVSWFDSVFCKPWNPLRIFSDKILNGNSSCTEQYCHSMSYFWCFENCLQNCYL